MTDFDKLIKEKAEQAQYAYKPSAWKGFLKHSGLKVGLSGMQIAAVAIISSVVVGSAIFAILKTAAPKMQTPQVEEMVAVPSDTVVAVEKVDEPELAETAKPADKTATVVKKPAEEADVETPEESSKPAPKQSNVKKDSKPYMVPVRINVDTIVRLETTDEELRNGNSRIY